KEMEAQQAEGATEHMTKKEALMFERELDKLNKSIGGIKDMNNLPDALFVVDVGYHKIAVAEARSLGIPVVAVVDTNHSPEGIEHVIPGNDDSGKAIALYVKGMADAVLEGRNQALHGPVEEIAEGDDALVVFAVDSEQCSLVWAHDLRWFPAVPAARWVVARWSTRIGFCWSARSLLMRAAIWRPGGRSACLPPRRRAGVRFKEQEITVAQITASMVKELREKTDAPMMECKKALAEADGDMARAEELLRVKLGS